jgi:hypothetical protein
MTADNQTPPSSRAATAALLLAVLFVSLAGIRSIPPAPRAADSDEGFSAHRALEVLERLFPSQEPHPIGSQANLEMRRRIETELAALGLEPEIRREIGCSERLLTCGHVVNVVARIPGTDGPPAVLLATHYDSVAAGPGVADDGSGVAIAIEIARILLENRPSRDVIILIDDGEEAGLLGAEAFVAHDPLASEVGVVVNLEARGTSGLSHLFETSDGNGWMIARAGSALPRPSASSVFYEIYRRLPNDTDLTVFKRHGMQGINFAFIGDPARYHTPSDRLEFLSHRTLQHQGDNALAAVRALAGGAVEETGNRVYFDLFGFTLVHWPEAWVLPLSILALVLALASLLLFRIRGGVSGAGLLWSVIIPPLQIAVAGATMFLLLKLASAIGSTPAIWTLHPLLLLIAMWLSGFTAVAAGALLISRLTTPLALLPVLLVEMAVAGLAVAVYLPGASYLFIVPALAGSVVSIAVLLSSGATLSFYAGAFTTAAVAMALFFPMAWSFYAAMGYPILPIASIFVALGAASLTAVLATAPRALQWFYLVTLPLLALAATLLSPLLEPFSPGSPAHGNLIVVQREGENFAIAGERLASHLTLPWSEPDPSLFPWVEPPLRFRAAGVAPVEVPPLDIARYDRFFPDGTRHVQLLVRPDPDAKVVEIHLGGAGIRSLRIEDRAMPDSDESWRVARVYGSRRWTLRFRVDAGFGEPEIIAQQIFPLSPEHRELLARRPSWLRPVGPGDRLAVQTRVPEQVQDVDIEE